MKKLFSLSITILLIPFFPPRLFAANLLDIGEDDQKEGSSVAQLSTTAPTQTMVQDYTILNNKNINHVLNDIEEAEEDLGDSLLAVDAKLVTTNNQSSPLLLGAVLQHKQNNELHQYLIANTGLLSETTQLSAVKKAHKRRFHLIKATSGHVSLQLLEWLQVSQNYTVAALCTNRPVCRHCYLVVNSLWKKQLQTNEKGCFSKPFPLLDKLPALAQQYINTHLNLSLVQSFVVPMIGCVSKEEMNKAIQQKDKEVASFIASMEATKDKQIAALSNEVKTKKKQLKEKKEEITTLKSTLKKEMIQHERELNRLLEEVQSQNYIAMQLNEQRELLADELDTKYNQLKEKKEPKLLFDDNIKVEWQEAIKKGNTENVKNILREHYVDINALDKYGDASLHDASRHNHEEIVKVLLTAGANINVKNEDGKTPLCVAAMNESTDVVELLVKNGANVNMQNKEGESPLHWAAYNNNMRALELLISNPNLDIQDKYGMTPLHEAVQRNNLEAVQILIEANANKDIEDEKGRTVLDLAIECKDKNKKEDYSNVINYLKSL